MTKLDGTIVPGVGPPPVFKFEEKDLQEHSGYAVPGAFPHWTAYLRNKHLSVRPQCVILGVEPDMRRYR